MSDRYRFARIPEHGEPVTIEAGELTVPDHPIIPFIEGDGTGPDIWRATRRVLDAAVEKAFGGGRRIAEANASARAPLASSGGSPRLHMAGGVFRFPHPFPRGGGRNPHQGTNHRTRQG